MTVGLDHMSARSAAPDARASSLHNLLRSLVLASAVPLVAAITASLLIFFLLQEWQLDPDNERLALMARRSVDAQISQRLRALEALAQSSAINGRTVGLESYEAAIGYRRAFSADVVVADLQGNMLLNTRVPWGKTLPVVPTPHGRSAFQEALQRRQTAVGDLFIGPVSKTPMIALATVALDAGVPFRAVMITLEAELIHRWLEDLLLTGSQAIAFLDSKGALIASSGPYVPKVEHFSPWIKEHRVTLDHAPFQLVIQSNAWTFRLPSLVAGLTMLMGLVLALTLSLAASKRLAHRLKDDLAALAPLRQGLSRTFICREAYDLAQAQAREHTARQVLLDRLEHQERLHWDILQRLPEPMLMSRAGRVVRVNDLAEKLLATPSEKLIGRPWLEILHPDERQRIEPLLLHVQTSPGATERKATRIIRGDGGVQPISLAMVHVEQEDGPLVMSVLQPVSEVVLSPRVNPNVAATA